MPMYTVPVIRQIGAIVLVAAKSRKEAIRRAENGEWNDVYGEDEISCEITGPAVLADI